MLTVMKKLYLKWIATSGQYLICSIGSAFTRSQRIESVDILVKFVSEEADNMVTFCGLHSDSRR